MNIEFAINEMKEYSEMLDKIEIITDMDDSTQAEQMMLDSDRSHRTNAILIAAAILVSGGAVNDLSDMLREAIEELRTTIAMHA
jgi:hypothetical protein